jgi:hypothetical protein
MTGFPDNKNWLVSPDGHEVGEAVPYGGETGGGTNCKNWAKKIWGQTRPLQCKQKILGWSLGKQ